MRDASPYKLGEGTKPPYLAGRDELMDMANKYLRAMDKGYPQKSVIYYGLRGAGKTILLNSIEKIADELEILYAHIEIAEKERFLGQFISASKKIIHRMSLVESAKDNMNEALGFLQEFSITSSSLPDDLTEMLVLMGRVAQKANKAICLFIDDIQHMNGDEIEALVIALHRVNQLGLPIMIFGTGLPVTLKLLREAKFYSERLFNYVAVK